MVIDLGRCPVSLDKYKRFDKCLITIRDARINTSSSKEIGRCAQCGGESLCWTQPRCEGGWYVCPSCFPIYCVACKSNDPEIGGAKVGGIIWE